MYRRPAGPKCQAVEQMLQVERTETAKLHEKVMAGGPHRRGPEQQRSTPEPPDFFLISSWGHLPREFLLLLNSHPQILRMVLSTPPFSMSVFTPSFQIHPRIPPNVGL